MCRFVQYFIKFALPTLESQGERYSLFITKLKKLEGNMSLTRKVLRFGKQLPLLRSIITRARNHNERVIFWRSVSDLAQIIYCTLDHPLYMQKVGFIKFKNPQIIEKLERIKNILRLLSRVIDILVLIVELYYIQKEIDHLVSFFSS